MNSPSRPILLGWLLVGVFVLFGCSYSITDLSQMAPKPDVTIKVPPRITSANVTFKQKSKTPYYEYYTCCDICCDWWGCWTCCWTCSRWLYTEVVGDIDLTVYVEDRSNDLVEKESPVLKVLASKQVSGAPGGPKPCLLDIKKDLPLTKDNISGTGFNKVVNTSIEDVSIKFTYECPVFAANLPLRIHCNDQGVSVDSNLGEVPITVKDP